MDSFYKAYIETLSVLNYRSVLVPTTLIVGVCTWLILVVFVLCVVSIDNTSMYLLQDDESSPLAQFVNMDNVSAVMDFFKKVEVLIGSS